jgi:hypothetical protein
VAREVNALTPVTSPIHATSSFKLFRTVFEFMAGQFSTDQVIDQCDNRSDVCAKPIIAFVLCILFFFLNFVILLNLIISVMSDAYNRCKLHQHVNARIMKAILLCHFMEMAQRIMTPPKTGLRHRLRSMVTLRKHKPVVEPRIQQRRLAIRSKSISMLGQVKEVARRKLRETIRPSFYLHMWGEARFFKVDADLEIDGSEGSKFRQIKALASSFQKLLGDFNSTSAKTELQLEAIEARVKTLATHAATNVRVHREAEHRPLAKLLSQAREHLVGVHPRMSTAPPAEVQFDSLNKRVARLEALVENNATSVTAMHATLETLSGQMLEVLLAIRQSGSSKLSGDAVGERSAALDQGQAEAECLHGEVEQALAEAVQARADAAAAQARAEATIAQGFDILGILGDGPAAEDNVLRVEIVPAPAWQPSR